MTSVDRTELQQQIDSMREEGRGDRGEFYETFGSAIRGVLVPLAALLEANLDSNPELVELTLRELTQRSDEGRKDELWAAVAAPKAARAELPEYFAPKPTASGLNSGNAEGSELKLWRFNWDVGRAGVVESVFVAKQSEIDAALGSYVFFGEILGKHSDVRGRLDLEDLQVLSEDPALIALFQKHVGGTGHNPLDYMDDEL